MTVGACAVAELALGAVCADAAVTAQRTTARNTFFTIVLSLGETLGLLDFISRTS